MWVFPLLIDAKRRSSCFLTVASNNRIIGCIGVYSWQGRTEPLNLSHWTCLQLPSVTFVGLDGLKQHSFSSLLAFLDTRDLGSTDCLISGQSLFQCLTSKKDDYPLALAMCKQVMTARSCLSLSCALNGCETSFQH